MRAESGDAKGTDPYVILGQLVGLILVVSWSVGLAPRVEEFGGRTDASLAGRLLQVLPAGPLPLCRSGGLSFV